MPDKVPTPEEMRDNIIELITDPYLGPDERKITEKILLRRLTDWRDAIRKQQSEMDAQICGDTMKANKGRERYIAVLNTVKAILHAGEED